MCLFKRAFKKKHHVWLVCFFFLMDNMEEAEVRQLCNKWHANAWDLRCQCGKQQDKHNSFNLDNSSENKEEK